MCSIAPHDQAPEREPRVRLAVTHTTHQQTFYEVSGAGGWRVDAASRCIIVGHGMPRTYIPLDAVLYFELERS